MSDPDELNERWEALTDQLGAVYRALQTADKAVRGVISPNADPQAARHAVEAIRNAVPLLSREALTAGSLDKLSALLANAASDWRLGRLGALKAAAEAEGLRFERLTSEEVRIGEATVVLDLEKGDAEIRYAREPLNTVRADPATIVGEVQRQMENLRQPEIEPAALFGELVAAYRATLGRQGLPAGERVNLVDLIPALFLQRQTDAFWKKQDTRHLRRVTRAQVAWDLDALHRARALEQNGQRIVLGTATGGSASKKANVLFLESGPAGGQYYLTFAVKPSA